MLRFPSDRDEEITEARRQRDGANQELSRVETKINLIQESVKEKKKEAQGDQWFPWDSALAGANIPQNAKRRFSNHGSQRRARPQISTNIQKQLPQSRRIYRLSEGE